MVIFDPQSYIQKTKAKLMASVSLLRQKGIVPKVAAIMYVEDKGSQLYTGIKKDMAAQLGIEYEVFEFSLTGGIEPVLNKLRQLNEDSSITGIIVQKPTRKIWVSANFIEGEEKEIKKTYDTWWRLQTNLIAPRKDVDGLNPSVIEAILNDRLVEQNRVMPATARAVLEIFNEAEISLNDKKIVILGKSDLLGLPLFNYFLSKKYQVENLGRKELAARVEKGIGLTDFDVVISATGVKNLITAELVKDGVIVVDVGEPKGDVDFESVKNKASFITPVPGGVGPMTVISLMANLCDLIED